MIRLLLALTAALPAVAQPAVTGQAVFEARCASCHAARADAPPGAGPNLAGVIGRQVGGSNGFDYSPVLEAAREAGQRWTAPMLEEFLVDPEAMYPGLWMGGNGLRSAADRAAVAAFLERP